MKKEQNTDPGILTRDLRVTLKKVVQAEIQKLPEYFENMEPRQRVETLIKLLPYVFPRVEPVHLTEGEPSKFDW